MILLRFGPLVIQAGDTAYVEMESSAPFLAKRLVIPKHVAQVTKEDFGAKFHIVYLQIGDASLLYRALPANAFREEDCRERFEPTIGSRAGLAVKNVSKRDLSFVGWLEGSFLVGEGGT